MSAGDAFDQEMDAIRSLTEEDELRLFRGQEPASGELAEVAAFARTLRSALLEPAPPALAAGLVPRLAEAARAGSAAPALVPRRFSVPSLRGRRPLLRIAFALAAIPVLFAGLAFAGVNLPDPARSAFETIGIELPNQPADEDDDDTEGTAKDGDSAGSATGQENSAGKRGHGRLKSNPARERGRSQGEQGKGRALGKGDLAPGKIDQVPGSQKKAPEKPVTPPAGGRPPDPPGKGDSGSEGGGAPPTALGDPGGASGGAGGSDGASGAGALHGKP